MFIKSNFKMVARFTTTILCLVGLSGAVRASLIAYEPFNYTTSIPNGTASTASGFSGNWVCGATPSIAGNLTYPNLSTTNSSLGTSANGRQILSLATPLSSGTKYISFLFNQAGNNGANYCG